jgi:hypothetical protein
LNVVTGSSRRFLTPGPTGAPYMLATAFRSPALSATRCPICAEAGLVGVMVSCPFFVNAVRS